jgi:hypothetical protein
VTILIFGPPLSPRDGRDGPNGVQNTSTQCAWVGRIHIMHLGPLTDLYGTPGAPKRARFRPEWPFWRPRRSSEGPGGPDLIPTAPDWPVWVGLMVTTHFDLVLGPFWAPGGPKRAHFGPNVPNFHGPIFVGYFLCSKYSLVGCPEHHNGTPCSSSTVTAHMEPSSLRKQTPSAQLRVQTT